jgi:hypothetical protein
VFVTSQGTPLTRFRRAIETRSIALAELAAREAGPLPLEDALSLVLLYEAERSPKYDRAAVRLLGRLCDDGERTLRDAQLAAAALASLRDRPGPSVRLLRSLFP